MSSKTNANIKTIYIGGVKYMLLPYKAIDSMFTEIARTMPKSKQLLLSKMCLTIARRNPIKENGVLYFAISGKELHGLRNMLEFVL